VASDRRLIAVAADVFVGPDSRSPARPHDVDQVPDDLVPASEIESRDVVSANVLDQNLERPCM
jgi:hypothetical protein